MVRPVQLSLSSFRSTFFFIAATSLLVLAFTFGSCKKSDDAVDPSSTVNLTEDDAANTFAHTLAGGQGTCGLTTQLEEAATVAGGAIIPKRADPATVLFDTSITRQRTGTYSYSYSFRYSYGLASASRFDFNYSMKGSYDTPRMASSDSSYATLELTNLLAGPSYSLAAFYNRYGTQTSKVGNKVSFRCTITFAITSVLIDKSTKKVTGGSATMSMSGQTSSGKIFAFNGSTTFLGSGQANFVIGTRSYLIDLVLGVVTPLGTM
jgi:hypothetical protein